MLALIENIRNLINEGGKFEGYWYDLCDIWVETIFSYADGRSHQQSRPSSIRSPESGCNSSSAFRKWSSQHARNSLGGDDRSIRVDCCCSRCRRLFGNGVEGRSRLSEDSSHAGNTKQARESGSCGNRRQADPEEAETASSHSVVRVKLAESFCKPP